MHVIAGKAVAFLEAMQPGFVVYQQQVLNNAVALARELVSRDYPIVSGQTDNHLMLVDLVNKKSTGKDADEGLGRAHITVNMNSVPNDPRPPKITSGIRLGTPAVTTRGFKEPEMHLIANWIADILDSQQNEVVIQRVRQEVLQLCRQFPVYS
jgi:glycine hydroxymethyltransferase